FMQSPSTYTADVFLQEAPAIITLEYFEGGGGALAQVSWQTLVGSDCYANVHSDNWKGEFFSNTELAGDPLIVRDYGDGSLNFDVGEGSPGAACGVGADNFSARWTRWVELPLGKYRFTVTGDDGVRLYVGGKLIIDKWFDQSPTTYTADLFLTTNA